MSIVLAIVVAGLLLVVGGLVQQGYMTRVWKRRARTARGQTYEDEPPN